MKNGDEPASPTGTYDAYSGKLNGQFFGLTKRELIAAMALQGILSSGEGVKTLLNSSSKYPDTISKFAIKVADELLAQLESKDK